MKMQTYSNKLLNTFCHTYKKYKSNIFLNVILNIASVIYFLLYKSRLYLYEINLLKSHSLPVPVISIGNITTGGTGKTPLTIEIAKYLISLSYKVAILSRGYKRKNSFYQNSGTILVSDGQEILTDYRTSGDEPYLIAKKLRKALVLVNKDRYKAGLAAIKLGAEILILDDGYQHIQLNRDINILLVNAQKPFDNGFLLPKGMLRELPDSIKRSTSIIISNPERSVIEKGILEQIKNYSNDKPITNMTYKIKQLKSLNTKNIVSTESAKGIKVVAFCGIANPDSFINLLKQNGLIVLNQIYFPDHHDYINDDINKIIKLSEEHKIDNIVTTEKDAIKIETLCESAPATFWACELEIVCDIKNVIEKILLKTTSKITI